MDTFLGIFFWNPLVFTDDSFVENSPNPMICPACRDKQQIGTVKQKLVKGMYRAVTSLEATFFPVYQTYEK